MRFAFVVCALAACKSPTSKVDAGSGSNPHGDGGPGDGVTVDADPQCATPGVIPPFTLKPFASGLARPVYLTSPKGSSDIYVVEEVGRIRIIRNGNVLSTPFLDVTSMVYSPGGPVEGEAGLLGLAFAPDYATSGRFFIYLTTQVAGEDSAGIYEFRRSSNPDIAATTPTPVLVHRQNDYNNLAGNIAFGPDGFLYAGIGDGASVPSASADLSSPRGKILRIDIDHPTQAVPGNMTGGEPHVWDMGLRNPYRFSFDRVTGDLYIGEAGEDHADEIDVEPRNTGKRNYGWPHMEANRCEDGTMTCANQGTLPSLVIEHAPVSSVVIGGAVYRGSLLPCLRGRYFYTMHGLGTFLSFVWNGSAVTDQMDLTDKIGNADLFNVSSISEDGAGELYVTTLPGIIYKLQPP